MGSAFIQAGLENAATNENLRAESELGGISFTRVHALGFTHHWLEIGARMCHLSDGTDLPLAVDLLTSITPWCISPALPSLLTLSWPLWLYFKPMSLPRQGGSDVWCPAEGYKSWN